MRSNGINHEVVRFNAVNQVVRKAVEVEASHVNSRRGAPDRWKLEQQRYGFGKITLEIATQPFGATLEIRFNLN